MVDLLAFQTGPVATYPENYACLPIFSLVVEINLGEKCEGQVCSRGKADENTRKVLLAA